MPGRRARTRVAERLPTLASLPRTPVAPWTAAAPRGSMALHRRTQEHRTAGLAARTGERARPTQVPAATTEGCRSPTAGLLRLRTRAALPTTQAPAPREMTAARPSRSRTPAEQSPWTAARERRQAATEEHRVTATAEPERAEWARRAVVDAAWPARPPRSVRAASSARSDSCFFSRRAAVARRDVAFDPRAVALVTTSPRAGRKSNASPAFATQRTIGTFGNPRT